MNKLSKTLLLRRSLVNWTQVARVLNTLARGYSKQQSMAKLPLHFRNSVDIEATVTAIWPLIIYYDFAKKLGILSNNDLTALASVMNDIHEKLKHAFNPDELKRGAHGGKGPFDMNPVFLFLTVRKYVPNLIVETGVAQGISSYLILKALQINGKGELISIDLPNRDAKGFTYQDGTYVPVYTPLDLESGWLVPQELRNIWDLRLGRSSELLSTIQGKLDLFYHDSEHSYQNMMFEFEWAYEHLKAGGILASDDITWNSAFSDFAHKHKDMRPLFDQSIFPALIKH